MVLQIDPSKCWSPLMQKARPHQSPNVVLRLASIRDIAARLKSLLQNDQRYRLSTLGLPQAKGQNIYGFPPDPRSALIMACTHTPRSSGGWKLALRASAAESATEDTGEDAGGGSQPLLQAWHRRQHLRLHRVVDAEAYLEAYGAPD